MASEPGGIGRTDPPLLNPGGIIPHFAVKTACKNYVTWALITTNELQTQLECDTIGEARMSGQSTAAIREYRMAEVPAVDLYSVQAPAAAEKVMRA